jgi:hypothetical protein
VIGIDIGKNSFHIVGHDHRGAIVLRQKWSRGQVETRLRSGPSLRPSRTASLTFSRSRRSSGGSAITASWISVDLAEINHACQVTGRSTGGHPPKGPGGLRVGARPRARVDGRVRRLVNGFLSRRL